MEQEKVVLVVLWWQGGITHPLLDLIRGEDILEPLHQRVAEAIFVL